MVLVDLSLKQTKRMAPFITRRIHITRCITYLIVIGSIFNAIPSFSQVDTITFRVETAAAFSTQGYLPLWIVSNRFGVLAEDQANGYVRAGLAIPYANKKFAFAAGIDGLLTSAIGDSRIQQGYVKMRYGAAELKGGLEEEIIGMADPTLSTGSLYISNNARPVPRVTFSFPEYTNVPFTDGYVQFKASYSHGWLGRDRFVKKPFLHEKYLYLRVGKNWKVTPYGGLVHSAIWGGVHPVAGALPDNLKSYLKVILVRSGKGTNLGGEIKNTLGDHRGIMNFGFEAELKNADLLFYNQMFYEDGSGTELFITNRDILTGISVKYKDKNRLVSGFAFEFLYTKYQSGPGLPDPYPDRDNYDYPFRGRDNYYNNYLYNSGWVNGGYILGTPLFLTDYRADLYFDGYEEPTRQSFDFNIVNNRIVSHHIGLEGTIARQVRYRAFVTYTRNFGTYGGLNGGIQFWGSRDPDYQVDYKFDPPLNQFYFMLEAVTGIAFNNQMEAMATLGYDAGEMTNNLGVMLGIRWKGLLYDAAKKRELTGNSMN